MASTSNTRTYSLRARRTRSERNIGNAGNVPDSTQVTPEVAAQESEANIRNDMGSEARDAHVRGSREDSPDPNERTNNPPSDDSDNSGTVKEINQDEYDESQWPPGQYDSFSMWVRGHPNRSRNDLEERNSDGNAPRPEAPRAEPLMPALPIVNKNNTDTAPQVRDAIGQAENSLSAEDRERINRRYENVTSSGNQPRNRSREAGPSRKRTGKAIDPRNWGNIDLGPDEVDEEMQAQLLNNFSKGHKQSGANNLMREDDPAEEINPPRRERSQSGFTRERSQRIAETRPLNQIPADSYLGRALGNINRFRTRRIHYDGSSPSDSSSSSSNNSNNNSDNEGDAPRRRDRHKKKENDTIKRRKSKKSKKSKLKPIAPTVYNGAADARAYNRFLSEGTAYVLDNHVPPSRHVFVLSYYLIGTAYDFYTQKVSLNFDKWTLTVTPSA
jgi:hypothetical protein